MAVISKMGIQKIAKEIILDELDENMHMEKVEDVIFWALEHYANQGHGTLGEIIAYSIVQRIKEEEAKYSAT
ncbi:MAG: hypothetical protein AAFO91_05565, partial [Bacteroidota bacterium]